jgi:hypothetical protein
MVEMVTSVSPTSPRPGEKLTIKGVSLSEVIGVTIGGVSAQITKTAPTSVKIIAPRSGPWRRSRHKPGWKCHIGRGGDSELKRENVCTTSSAIHQDAGTSIDHPPVNYTDSEKRVLLAGIIGGRLRDAIWERHPREIESLGHRGLVRIGHEVLRDGTESAFPLCLSPEGVRDAKALDSADQAVSALKQTLWF